MKYCRILLPSLPLCWLFACTLPNDAPPAEIISNDLTYIQPLQKAIHTYPDSIALYEKLIDTLANRERYDLAAQWCDTVMLRDKAGNRVVWQLVKGDLLRMGKIYDSAIAAYKSYLQVFPNDEQVLLNLANTLADSGNPEALALCRKIDAMFPNAETRSGTAYIAGLYYNITGQYQQARIWLDSAITLKYAFTEAWFERGYSFFDEKKFAEAETNFRQLTRISTGDADAWYWLAKSMEAQGKKASALEYYTRAYSLNRKLADARRAMERLKKELN